MSSTSSNPSPNPSVAPVTVSNIELRLTPDLTIDDASNQYTLLVECAVYSGGKAVSSQRIQVKNIVSVEKDVNTDANGIALVSLSGTLSKTETKKVYRFCLVGSSKEEQLAITIPAMADSKAEISDDDPVSLILSRYHDGNGNFSVHARVLKAHGIGFKTKVNIWYRGQNQDIDTDQAGNAIYIVPGTLAPGESFSLSASVSGIHNSAKLKISRPKDPPHSVTSFTKDWYLGTNNGRAFVLICATIWLWFICFLVGPGEPLINDMTFRNDSSGLSKQEQIYNDIVSKVDHNQMIAKKSHDSEWQHWFWKAAILLSIFTLIYAPLSLREEITEGIREGFENLMDRGDAQSGDPKFEKFVKWAGTYSVARRKAKVKVTEEKDSKVSDNEHPGLGTLFSLDLLSDALVEIVPAIIKKVF